MKNCVICGKTANGLVWIECEPKDGVDKCIINVWSSSNGVIIGSESRNAVAICNRCANGIIDMFYKAEDQKELTRQIIKKLNKLVSVALL